MSSLLFILRSLVHHRRIHVAVALGVMAATAVLTGALLVGDSVRGSLRHLALDRLGAIDNLLVSDRFFRAALADELTATEGFKTDFAATTPAILLPGGTLEAGGASKRRASNVMVLGGDESFWKLHRGPSPLPAMKQTLADDDIILNAPLADELGVAVGDEVVLRLPSSQQVPADSPLGKKEGRIQTLAGLKIVAVIPAEGLGRFSLRSSQHAPRNAFVSLAALQATLDQRDKVNALLVTEQPQHAPRPDAANKLAKLLKPTFEDFGFTVQHIRSTFRPKDAGEDQVAFEYFSFTSDRMVIEPAAERLAKAAFQTWQTQPVLTYLAIGIEKIVANADDAAARGPSIPYSTISAVDSIAGLGPLVAESSDNASNNAAPLKLADHEIVLNRWAADDLKAAVGDKIRVTYFEPETTHGQAVESAAEFTLKAIVPLTEPDFGFRGHRPAKFSKRPTLANDPDLTPTVEGITDQDSINAWDPPFPYDSKRVRKHDDVYWQDHRTTPKAFVSLAAGRKIWGSRFGATTSIRIPANAASDVSPEAIKQKFLEQVRRDEAPLGLEFIAVKYQALAASSGTTPFDGLFLGLSFFIIAAALLLVALLFRLGIEQRATELGVLTAVGVPPRLTAAMLMREGAIVAAIGGCAGVAVGVGYAWLMLTGLRTWWLGAIVTPFLNLYVTPKSLVIGYVSGLLTSAGMIWWTIRRARRVPVRSLLSGVFAEAVQESAATARSAWPGRSTWLIGGLLLLAVVLAIAATQLAGEAQAGCFVGAGMMLLVALLLLIWGRFHAGLRSSTVVVRQLTTLASRNAGRNPGRSTLTIGLMAIASFLIIALSAFRLDPSLAGAGGFNLVAETSQPVFVDLNREETRSELFGPQSKELASSRIFGLRLKPGDDASCNNLYQATQPRVLGVTDAFIRHFDNRDALAFPFAASSATSPTEHQNPWQLLTESNQKSEIRNQKSPIPVVLDKNTAMYSLHLYGGVGQEFSIDYEDGVTARFRVAGLLSNSALQGSLLISEADFVRLFPRVSGYRFFLIQTPVAQQTNVAALLEDKLSDQGFDTTSTRDLLTNLLAVQNTYLSTFQSLGALGLLLGTFGLATVQLRNVLERRKELALMRATGFTSRRLASMVLLEHLVLLFGGLGVGVFAALVAVIPHMLSGGAAVPWRDLLWMLLAILIVGILSGLAAVRATLRAPVIGSLRGE